jgi:hypothetical protein
MAALAELQQSMPESGPAADQPHPLSWVFGAGGNGESLPKKGFEHPEHAFTRISDLEAEIECPSPKQSAELELIIGAVPFLGDGETTKSVKVEANGMPLGTLTLQDSVHFYPLPIPAAVNRNPTINLRFTCAPAPSLGSDGKRVEMGLTRLALVPIGLPTAPQSDRKNQTVLNRE